MKNTVTNQFLDIQREMLSKCVVKFQFQKKDGSIKEAVGTTNNKFIPEDKQPKDAGKNHKDNAVPYYDLEEGKWKSMQINAQFMPLKSWKSVPAEYRNNSK